MDAVTGHLVLDEDVAIVIDFMERHVPADRLAFVAACLPKLANLLWSPENPRDRCASVYRSLGFNCAPLPSASESSLGQRYADGGSAAVDGGQMLK